MNAHTLILSSILIVTTSFSGALSASTDPNADAQAQAAALLRGQAVRSAGSIEKTKHGTARGTHDAQAHAAALLRGSRTCVTTN